MFVLSVLCALSAVAWPAPATAQAWPFGLFAPPGLPREVTVRLAQATTTILSDADLRARLPASGVLGTPLEPDAFAELIRRDQERFADIKRRANIQVVK